MQSLLHAFPSQSIMVWVNGFVLLGFVVCAVFWLRKYRTKSLLPPPIALSNKTVWTLFALILCVGAVVRLWKLTVYPIGFPEDECSIAYDAFCLANYGTDRFGYSMPVYLSTFGSGQSALPTYLVALSFTLLGQSTFALRLPQALLGIASLPAVYFLLKKVGGRSMGLCGMALLAISPWHIMMSRWMLDCNMAAGFLLLALAFFVYGLAEKPALLVPACFLFGLTLYCYAVSQIVLFLFLVAVYLCLLWCKKIQWRWWIPANLLLGIMAIPLVLLLLVGNNILPEIVTPFLSVPKIPFYRGNEVGDASFASNLWICIQLLFTQADDVAISNIKGYGIVYLFSLPFFLTGLCVGAVDFFRSLQRRTLSSQGVIFLLFVAAFFAGGFVPLFIWRGVNVWVPLLLLTALGLHWWVRRVPKSFFFFVGAYGLALVLFFHSYVFTRAFSIGYAGAYSAPDAIAYAEALPETDQVYYSMSINSSAAYIFSAYNNRLSPAAYQAQLHLTLGSEEVGFAYYTPTFGKLVFGESCADHVLEPRSAFVLSNYLDNIPYYENLGYETEVFQHFTVAYLPA